MTHGITAAERRKVQRLKEASEWLLRMEGTDCSDDDVSDWLRWCDADPENLEAFEALQSDWEDLDGLRSGAQSTPASPRRFLRSPRVWASAAALGVLALTTMFWTLFKQGESQELTAAPAQEVAATVTHRSTTLPDGSKVILSAQSRVNVHFNQSRRELDLSSGRAYFDVQHDESRPFVVRAGEVSVTAVGTAFDVRRGDDQVTVTVEEGVVEVAANTPASSGKPAKWRAEAGYQLTYSTRDQIASIESVDPYAALSWRNGELAYVRAPLGSVIEDLNRYSLRKVVLEDPSIGEMPFTGTAFASELDDWIRAVQQAYPITARETATGDIILSRRD